MAWQLRYLSHCERQLKSLDIAARARILRYMREWIIEGDSPYAIGKPLTGRWAGCWVYRVDEYRIICRIQEKRLVVLVVRAGHRGEVYN